MKTNLAVLSVVLVASVSLGGCGSNDTNKENTSSLTTISSKQSVDSQWLDKNKNPLPSFMGISKTAISDSTIVAGENTFDKICFVTLIGPQTALTAGACIGLNLENEANDSNLQVLATTARVSFFDHEKSSEIPARIKSAKIISRSVMRGSERHLSTSLVELTFTEIVPIKPVSIIEDDSTKLIRNSIVSAYLFPLHESWDQLTSAVKTVYIGATSYIPNKSKDLLGVASGFKNVFEVNIKDLDLVESSVGSPLLVRNTQGELIGLLGIITSDVIKGPLNIHSTDGTIRLFVKPTCKMKKNSATSPTLCNDDYSDARSELFSTARKELNSILLKRENPDEDLRGVQRLSAEQDAFFFYKPLVSRIGKEAFSEISEISEFNELYFRQLVVFPDCIKNMDDFNYGLENGGISSNVSMKTVNYEVDRSGKTYFNVTSYGSSPNYLLNISKNIFGTVTAKISFANGSTIYSRELKLCQTASIQ